MSNITLSPRTHKLVSEVKSEGNQYLLTQGAAGLTISTQVQGIRFFLHNVSFADLDQPDVWLKTATGYGHRLPALAQQQFLEIFQVGAGL